MAGGALRAQAAHLQQRLGHRFLAFAHEHGVEERSVGFRVEGARAAAEHEGVVLATVFGAQRDARQVQRLQHVGGRQLVRQRDADDVELAHRRAAFEREQRKPVLAHEVDEVNGGQEGALGAQVLGRVDDVRQNAHGLVRLAELVGVGIHHAEREVGLRLAHAAPFVVQIACRTFDMRKQPLEARP